MSGSERPPRPLVLGVAGTEPTDAERRFLAECDPYGFILFGRNVADPTQLGALVAALREAVGRDAPVLVDQEGGRVARLAPPHWRAAPAARRFGDLARYDPAAAEEAVRLNARLIAAELRAVGIDVDCLPVLDLPVPGADPVIGDRAFADDPATVTALGRACCAGLLDGGVTPVVKHVPGHGRATVDSHAALPEVDTAAEVLAEADFRPFRDVVSAYPGRLWAMTAHVVYRAIDGGRPATLSAEVIGRAIRGDIGFDGVLITDDLSMSALAGGMAERALSALSAGCDLALHCNGRIDEMSALAEAVPRMSSASFARLAAVAAPPPVAAFDAGAALERLDRLLGGTADA